MLVHELNSQLFLVIHIFPRFSYFAFLKIHRWFNITNIIPHGPHGNSVGVFFVFVFWIFFWQGIAILVDYFQAVQIFFCLFVFYWIFFFSGISLSIIFKSINCIICFLFVFLHTTRVIEISLIYIYIFIYIWPERKIQLESSKPKAIECLINLGSRIHQNSLAEQKYFPLEIKRKNSNLQGHYKFISGLWWPSSDGEWMVIIDLN